MTHVLAELKIIPKTQCNEAASLAKELGLDVQARRYEKPLAEDAFTALSGDEVMIWQRYCPTRYIPGGGQDVRKLEEYAFDSVPIEVMRHWKAIKDNYAFDRYEVWTTERTARANDPLLIGVLGTKLYLLARWGLESPGDLSLKEVAEVVAKTLWRTCDKDYERYGFFGTKTRYTGKLMYEWENRPFQAALRLSGWEPPIS
jgi:hypothetical protein